MTTNPETWQLQNAKARVELACKQYVASVEIEGGERFAAFEALSSAVAELNRLLGR